MQQRYVANRDVQRFLPFLLPHVRSGMDVLDVGCGVGSIALDLAATVAPGRVVGIDADPGQIEVARASAAERGIENAEFAISSVYELPFEGTTFDVVYANAVLMYVRDQVRALAQMRRVLRPDGLAAVIDDDLGTVVISPDRPELELAPRLFERAVAHEGGTLATHDVCAHSCSKPGSRARKGSPMRRRYTATCRPRAGLPSSRSDCSRPRA